MRAAQVVELGSPPVAAEIEGDGALEVTAVALNPLDLAVAAGRFYGGHPPLPYVPGCEAIARRDGTRAYVYGEGRGTTKDGFLVERTDHPGALAIQIPDGLDDPLARLERQTQARERRPLELEVDVTRLHFFDPETGLGVGERRDGLTAS